jgi:hypothetical protein
VVRVAEDADVPAIARLRRELALDQERDRGDPEFEGRFAAWWAGNPDAGSSGWLKWSTIRSGR